MAVVNDKYRFIYLAEPYTASRSITHGLMRLEGSREVGQHDTLATLIDKYDVDPNYFAFRFVRHPADWLVTHYHHQTSWANRFKEFVANYVGDRHSVFYHNTGATYRYEDLHYELGRISELLYMPVVSIPWIGMTYAKEDFRSYYDQETKALLDKLRDWEAYGYRW